MPKITVLPHSVLCPEGAVFDAPEGQSLCDALLAHDIGIEHACGQCGACSTCHAIIRKGFDSLSEMGSNNQRCIKVILRRQMTQRDKTGKGSGL
ncbi:MAG: 2Fe-2S iron-sulfur cluster-binding protein [Oxalobacter sp.]